MGRLGMRVANVALFVLCTFLGARMVNQLSAALLVPDHGGASQTSARPGPAVRSWDERRPILERNLFGAEVGSGPPAAEEPPQENLQATKLPLRLLGTIASSDPVVASASIEDSSTKAHQVVKIGDAIKGHSDVSVVRIERRRVVLQNGTRREELRLSDNDVVTAAVASMAPPPARRPRRERVRPPPNTDEQSAAAADMLRRVREEKERFGNPGADPASSPASNPSTIFSQARILPKFEEGQMVGIELSKITPDSFYDKLGLSDGDVVTELNGIKIDHPSRSKELLEAFTSGQPLTATVVSAGGGTRTVTAGPEMLSGLGLGGATP